MSRRFTAAVDPSHLELVPIVFGAFSFLFYLVWQWAHRGSFAYDTAVYSFDDADEWRYTACSRLVEHGYALFSQVYSAQPPALFVMLATGMRVFGDSIDGARVVEVIAGVLALASCAILAASLGEKVAGSLTLALLAVSPGFLVYSRAIEAEIPMLALQALSLAVLARFSARCPRLAPGLAGGILALAVLTKLFALEALLPALWFIAVHAQDRRTGLRSAAIYFAASLVPVALEMIVVSPTAQWRQVVQLHSSAATASIPNLTAPGTVLWHFAVLDPGLTVLGLAGLLLLLLVRDWRTAGFLGTWSLGTLAMLATFRPLFPHHAVILLAPLAVAGGVGITTGLGRRRQREFVISAAAAILYIAFLPHLAHADRHALVPAAVTTSPTLLGYVESHSRPSDLVAADDLSLADRAQRLVVPSLCDPSNVRLRAGYLTSHDAIEATTQYKPRLVIASRGIYAQLPGYLSWLDQHYNRADLPGRVRAYSRPGR